MKKILFLILVIIMGAFGAAISVYADETKIDVVYPKKNPTVIGAKSSFFIGSTTPGNKLEINNVPVKVYSNGAFAQYVKLNIGKNKFQIKSCSAQDPKNAKTLNFIITRPKQKQWQKKSFILRPLKISNNYFTKYDGMPLRATAVDGGINRIAHLEKGMFVPIDGEYADFYRVFLTSEKSAWINKRYIEQKKRKHASLKPAVLKKFTCRDMKKYYLYEFDLSHKILYEVIEDKEAKNLCIKLYNVQGEGLDEYIIDKTLSMKIDVPKIFGYKAYYAGNKFVLKIKKAPKINKLKPLRKITIAVDPGHGGKELGAIGCCRDYEKDINLEIARKLKTELKRRGAKVVMTRDKDVFMSLKDRVKFAEQKHADILLSIHANALPDGKDPMKHSGTSVYYYHNQAKKLSDCILNSMVEKLGTNNDNVRQQSFALVRPTQSVSALVEVAYMINPKDYIMLLDNNFQFMCAKAISDGIIQYLKK